MYFAMLALAPLLADAATAVALEPPASPPLVAAAEPLETTEISVLTYNVKGLPWPVASGRAHALRQIGEELAAMRREGRQPDVVLLQEGFRGEVADLVAASGYRYWAEGPSRGARPSVTAGDKPDGWSKLTGAGLHVLSDFPILEVRSVAYSACAGLDCLANKGAMLVRLALKDAPVEIDVVNTHLNSRRAAKATLKRTLKAHNRQMEELIGFVSANASPERPLLVGGDFNVRNAPDRYYHKAAERPFTVVSEFCHRTDGGCGAAARTEEPWLRSQDLQGFASPATVQVKPQGVQSMFDGKDGDRLSDHDGYLVRYQISWRPTDPARTAVSRGLQVKPQFRNLGARVSWTY